MTWYALHVLTFFVISPFHESIFDRCQRFLLTRLSLTRFFFVGFAVILIVPGLLTQTDVTRNTNTDHYYMKPWTSVVFIGYFKWIPSQSAKTFQTHQQIFQASRLQHFSSILKCKCKFIMFMHAFQYKASLKRYTSCVSDFVSDKWLFFLSFYRHLLLKPLQNVQFRFNLFYFLYPLR